MTTRLALILTLLLAPSSALAVCRVVEPSTDRGPGVTFDPTTAAIYVLAPDQVVEATCPGGAPADAAHRCADGSPADVRRDTLASLVVQPTVFADGGTAGLVMPVPARPDVAPGDPALFAAAAALEDPWIEETVIVQEDPYLGYQCSDPHFSALHPGDIPSALWGCSEYYRPGTEDRETTTTDYGDAGTVRSEVIEVSDAYDVTVLNAASLDALFGWMDGHGFARREADENAFGSYVGEGQWFVAVHVHPEDLGYAQRLQALVVTWRGDTLPIQNQLQYDPGGGVLVTDAFVLAPERMETADESGFASYAAPTRFGGSPLEGFGLEDGWLTHLQITRISSRWEPDSEFVAAPEAGELRPTIERTTHARIAAPCCPGGRTALPDREDYNSYTHHRAYLASESPPIPPEWLGATPPPAACGGGTFGCGRDPERPHLQGCSVGSRGLGAALFGWGPLLLLAGALAWRRLR